ncbi:hypothetical protein T492DRAFT_833078 [Pavlovales sp. CCMP2436]|nr:hypothetical protein T492DRAFT_833078 [Pavlovales sp. CCMP2436]
MARRFHLQPLDAPLPVVPQGPLSKLPPVDAPRAPTRYVEPARPGVPSVGVGRTQFKLPKPGPRARLTDPASQPSFGALKGSAADAGAQALYGFNIEEIYDYDLPNIRSASATLTSMVGRTANPVAAARADALASKRLAPQAADELEGAVGGDGDEHPDMLVEDMGTQLKSGEEAANFFARHGNHTPTKFVYANRARTGDAFLPYSLMCVSREQAETIQAEICGVIS